MVACTDHRIQFDQFEERSGSPEVLMLTLVRHLSFSRFSPLGELRPPLVLETCIGLLDFGTSTGGREGVSTYTFLVSLIEFMIFAMVKVNDGYQLMVTLL